MIGFELSSLPQQGRGRLGFVRDQVIFTGLGHYYEFDQVRHSIWSQLRSCCRRDTGRSRRHLKMSERLTCASCHTDRPSPHSIPEPRILQASSCSSTSSNPKSTVPPSEPADLQDQPLSSHSTYRSPCRSRQASSLLFETWSWTVCAMFYSTFSPDFRPVHPMAGSALKDD